jgi:HrpA-like RNA helicase
LTYPSHVNTVIISDEVKSLIQLDGVDTLAYRPITRTEVQQLLGRIGRLEKDGTAVIRLTKSPTRGAQPLETYIPAEIQNINLATMMLRFQAAGRNLEKDNRSFIFAASDKQLAQAREELYYLGLFGPEGHITELGRAAARLPVDAPLGKLLAKAQDLRATYPKVLLAAIDIAANMEAEGIVPKSLRPWQDLRASNANSDVIAQVEVLQKAATMSQAQLEEHGIPEAQLYRALDMRRSLRARFSLEQAPSEISLSPVESKLLSDLYCSAFLPWLYRRIDAGRGSKSGEVLYKGVTNGDIRLLSKGSVVHNSQYIVAYPFNLELKEVSGRLEDLLERINGYEKTLPLLLHAHAVDPEWLKRNIPPQFREARESFKKSSRQQRGRDEDRPPTRFRPRH